METTLEAPFELRGITKRLGNFTLGPIDLIVPRGYVMGLVGANGAGKTTSIKIGLGLVHADGGTATLVDRTKLGTVLDTAPYPPNWQARETGELLGRFYPHWDQARFDELLDWGGISPSKKVTDLSRGMSLRLQLAVAFAHQAELLVLDEPTSGLDPLARSELVDMIAEFMTDERHAVLFSTHITSDLERVADYLTLVNHGQVVSSGPRDELIDSYRLVRGTNSQLPRVRELVRGLREHTTGWEGLMATEETAGLFDLAVVEAPSLEDIVVAFAKEN